MLKISSKILSHVALATSLLALAACSSTGNKTATGAAAAQGDQVYSSGLGTQQNVYGQNADATGHLTSGKPAVGGENQTYYFDFDNTTIHSADMQSVGVQANYLNKNSGAQVLLEGNTDAQGSREYNVGLGERRAKSVKDSLVAQGANAGQIRTISYGQERPAATGNDESSYRLNRRVELVYEKKA